MPRSLEHLPLLVTGAVVLLAALACGSGDDDDEAEDMPQLEVECIGMLAPTPLGGYQIVRTRYGGRCRALVSDTLFADTLEIIDGNSLGSGEPNMISLQVQYGGHVWVSREGSVQLTRNEGNLVEGHFDVIATNENGERAHLFGPMDWCAYGNRADCPYQTHGGLTKEISYSEPDGFDCDDGCMLSECRVLIDRATGGVQVDGRFGLFRHINVGHWPYQCEYPSALDGGFTFRSGGVDGPGTYGPFRSHDTELIVDDEWPLVLPEFELFVPKSWFGWSTACLTDWGKYIYAHQVSGETVCSFTIEDGEPGRFSLECTDAMHGESHTFAPVQGDFTLEADCDVRYTD